jgi:hypothetical protein
MHQLLSLKVKIWTIVGLAALISAFASLADLGPLSLGAVVAIVEFVVLYALARSWPLVQALPRFLRPGWAKANLSGEWRGTITSQWRASPDDPPPPSIPVTMVLRQGWREVVFSLETDKMRSRSSAAMPAYDPTTHELNFRYFFETSPTAESSTTNPPQKLGSAIARVSLDRPGRMSIMYANERSQGGDIILERAARISARTSKRQRGSPSEVKAYGVASNTNTARTNKRPSR